MPKDKIKILEERLNRLEAALAQLSGSGGETPPPRGAVIVDPATWGGVGGGWHTFPGSMVDLGQWPYPSPSPSPWPMPGDALPPDLSRITPEQLETTLHSIAAERTRLDSMEAMIKKHLESAKKPPPKAKPRPK
jgi:hypothetical protein